MNNYILAIDPSLTQTGIALLDKKGKIIFKGIFKTKPKDKDERYFQIMTTLDQGIKVIIGLLFVLQRMKMNLTLIINGITEEKKKRYRY